MGKKKDIAAARVTRKSPPCIGGGAGRSKEPIYNPANHAAAISVILAGGTDEEAATAAGASRPTLAYWRQTKPQFAADWANARRAVVTCLMLDAIERRTQLVNDWIDEVLTGRAVTTKKKYENGMLVSEEITSLPPDRWLISRILGEAPKAPEVFEVTVDLALPTFDDDDEEGDDA